MGTEENLFSIDQAETTPFNKVRLNHILRAAHIESTLLHPELLGNLLRLNDTKILGDEVAAITYFDNAASYLDSNEDKGIGFNEESSTLIRQATMLSDSGKAGWLGASADAKKTVTQLHSEDRRFDLSGTLEEYIDTFFNTNDELQQQRLAQDATTYSVADLKEQVAKMTDQGITLGMSMRDFFHLHVLWSYNLIMASSLDHKAEVAKTAELHHFLEGILPFPINFATEDINTLITREVIWVILLDKFDAQIRRSKSSPAEAIEWLFEYIDQDARGFELIQVDTERRQLQDRFRTAIGELAASLGVIS